MRKDHYPKNKSFFDLYKIGKIGFFVSLKSENKFDTVINHINLNLVHRDKYHFIFHLIQLL